MFDEIYDVDDAASYVVVFDIGLLNFLNSIEKYKVYSKCIGSLHIMNTLNIETLDKTRMTTVE